MNNQINGACCFQKQTIHLHGHLPVTFWDYSVCLYDPDCHKRLSQGKNWTKAVS